MTMKRNSLASIFLLVVGFLFSAPALANILNPPGTWNISSDYGPRNLSTSKFHEGIDYKAPEGSNNKEALSRQSEGRN